MKKWLYLAALLATCYLNLVYDWPEGRTILVVENCGAFRIPVLWLWMGKNRKVVRDLKKGGRQTLIFP